VNRRIVFSTVVALAGLVVLAVTGAVLASVTDTEQLLLDAGSGFTAYLAIFGLVFADAIVPIFPGETTLNAASVLASQGELELGLVIVAGALGAVLGDSTLYWIARTGPRKLKARLESASQSNERVEKGLALLGRSGPLLITCGRFVPGVRFAVNVSMGVVAYPYRRFLLFSTIGGVIWAVYTCLLAYWVGTALADFPVASIIASGVVTTILIVGVYWIDRRHRTNEADPAPAPGAATVPRPRP
jgi:membrane protein DedA with SNARE-associated domain